MSRRPADPQAALASDIDTAFKTLLGLWARHRDDGPPRAAARATHESFWLLFADLYSNATLRGLAARLGFDTRANMQRRAIREVLGTQPERLAELLHIASRETA